jgi:hypothetical protein
MTLVLSIKVKEGLVLAADSRINSKPPRNDAVKILSFTEGNHRHVGALVSGNAVIDESDMRMPQELLPQLEKTLHSERLPVEVYARELHDFFCLHYKNEWEKHRKKIIRGSGTTTFLVAGFNENEDVGRVLLAANFQYLTEAPYFNDLSSRLDLPLDVTNGEMNCIVARGELGSVYQGAYKSCFSDNKELTKGLEDNRLELLKVPDNSSLKDAAHIACSLIQRTICYRRRLNQPTTIHDPIRVCTITQREELITCHG